MARVEKLIDLISKGNIASTLSADERREIADNVITGYKNDRLSRASWEERMTDALKLAKQITEPKTFPWEGAANVIFPLLTISSNVFAARTYPEIVKEGRIVKTMVFGDDPEGTKQERADRVSSHMSYQRLIESDTWEPDLDKLLHMLPIIGVCFRKVYYDPVTDLPQSDLCSPEDIIINHACPSIDKAYRITHRYYLNKNEIIEKIRNGYFIDFEYDKIQPAGHDTEWETDLDSKAGISPEKNNSVSCEILEVHTYLDLDGDGYEEPWIVVVDKHSNETLGIYPRFDADNISINDDGEITSIKAIQYFVDYHFLPSPDGGFYSMGYGHVMLPLNMAINSLMNQLLDAGTLSNTNSGLVGRSLKIKGGRLDVKIGEFTPVDIGTTGRIADAVYPFQFKDPSPVLLQLLSLLINSAKEMASITDVITGDANPQNSPATSVMELSSQGMKLFGSIAKRLYRSLKKEFELLYKLNGEYLDGEKYFNYFDKAEAIASDDYNDESIDIAPIADPQMSSDTHRSMQAQALAQLMQNQVILPELKVNNVVREFFEALKIPKDKVDKFLFTPEEKQQMQQQQGPNLDMMKLQLEQEKAAKDYEVKIAQVEGKNKELQVKYLDLQKKYALKESEAAEKQARMMADANFKNAQANHMNDKLDIERDKIEVMKQKVAKEG